MFHQNYKRAKPTIVEGQAMTMLQEIYTTTQVGAEGNSPRPISRRLRIGWQKEFHEKKLLNRSV